MASQEAIFIGANTQTHIADVDASTKMVAFGASNTIALWNPLDQANRGVFQTLKGHTKIVTGVKFIPNTPFIVSTAEDFSVKIWKRDSHDQLFKPYQTLDVHERSVTCLSVLNENAFITGSADGNVCIFSFDKEEAKFNVAHKFPVKVGFYPLTIEFINVERNSYILAVGGTDVRLYVYTFILANSGIDCFELSAVLSGHEDWIKCLKFRKESQDNWLLASGSQDRYIRLWRLRINESIDNTDEDSTTLILLSNKQYKFVINNEVTCAFNFEALIMGHDDWVTSLNWHPDPDSLQLVSSSADTALMIWEMEQSSGIWCCISRLGEMSIKGASTATGASGGFWSSLWFQEAGVDYILTNGKTGAFRVYSSADKGSTWNRQLGITGPTKECTDLSWSNAGDYILSTSLDQTTRLYAQWVYDNNGSRRAYESWHEFARPQIHGYDMICVSNISNTRFISGGDEKILRSFDEPKSIARLLSKLCGIDTKNQEVMPESASLPVLGLSNKASNDTANDHQEVPQDESTNQISAEIIDSLTSPPYEDHLQRHTLWPEIEKLYGHGYEITCVDTSPDGKLIASACRSNTAVHSVIRIFDAETWLEIKPPLMGHNLTITNIKFSPDNKYLLAVSRDRQFSLWERFDKQLKLINLNEKAHSRIIWDCAWAPKSMGPYFFTSSRDKTVKMWKRSNNEENVEFVSSIKVTDAVTSIDIVSEEVKGEALLSIGLENGSISIYSVSHKGEFKLVEDLPSYMTPADRVQKLAWSNKAIDGKHFLAVASNDHSTRIYSMKIHNS